jgi:hypothetical protein
MRRIPLANRVVLGLSVNLKTLDLLDHSSLGGAAMAPSGNAAPMASAATIFMSVDVFICVSLSVPRWVGTVPARQLLLCQFRWSTASN